MVREIAHNENGYTLVEVLVALAILSVVLSLVSAAFLFAGGRMSAWSDQISFYNNVQIVNDRLYNDLFSAASITYTDTTLTVTFEHSKQREYGWKGGTLTINKEPFLSPQDSVWIYLEEKVEGGQHIIEYVLLVQNETRAMRDSALIYVRKPTLWEPVNR